MGVQTPADFGLVRPYQQSYARRPVTPDVSYADVTCLSIFLTRPAATLVVARTRLVAAVGLGCLA